MKKIHAKVEVLSQSEIELIHKSSLKILENTGARVPNDELLDICERMGAIIDRDLYTLKIPARLMEEVLSKVKKSPLLNPECKGLQKITGNISTQIFINDYMTKTRRYGTLGDVMKGIALVEHLDYIPRSNTVVIPRDVPYNMSDVISYQRIYTHSAKPGGTYILTPTSAKYIIQMSKVMGRKVEYLFESISPLSFRKETLEMALLFAKEEQPLRMAPMVMAGTTGPVSLAGMLTLQNAEALISLFLIYALTNEFVPYVAGGHTSDIRTMICSFGSPNQALIGIAVAQMAEFYGLESGSNSGLSDSIFPDFQCGFEKAVSSIFSCLAGTAAIGGQGIVGADQGISLEQLVIDNEWLRAYDYIQKGIEVNEDTIGMDVIERVGIGGNFIMEDHTLHYMRDNYWPSKIFTRDSWNNLIEQSDTKDLLGKAHEFVQTCIDESNIGMPVIPESKVEELDYIVKAAEEELRVER